MIRQVLDPSHKDWVQGGVFSDLRSTSNYFTTEPIYIPPPNSLNNLLVWNQAKKILNRESFLLFSSLTPLENFLRFRRKKESHLPVIGTWFTHKEGLLSQRESILLKKSKKVFVHSQRIKMELSLLGIHNTVVSVGALNPFLFKKPALKGPKVAWAGTPTLRKRPEMFLAIVKRMPDIHFRLLGRGWLKSPYKNIIGLLQNLEYVEIDGALTSTHFNGCSVFLMTSKVEGGPMPLMESMASGLFPICTDTGFVDDLCTMVNLDIQPKISDNLEEVEFLLRRTLQNAEHSISFDRNLLLNYDYPRLAKVIFDSLVT